MCFFYRLKMKGKKYALLFCLSIVSEAFGMVPNQIKCAGQTTAPAELKYWVKSKFDCAYCCVTIQSLTLGSSRWRPWAGCDHSQSYSYGVEARPSQDKVRLKLMFPSYYEQVKASLFPVGCFGEPTMLHALSPRSRARDNLLAKQVLQARSKSQILKMIILKVLHP